MKAGAVPRLRSGLSPERPRQGRGSRRVVALVSGGIESLCLVRTLLAEGRVVVPLYVRCGLRWEDVELHWLRRWLSVVGHLRLRPLSVLSVPLRGLYEAHWSVTGRGVPGQASRDTAVYLPGRNVMLLSCAGLFAARHGLSMVGLGTLATNPFGDATPIFFRQMAVCLRHALGSPIQIMTPLRRWHKHQWLVRMRHEPFSLTFSCLAPSGRRHCGCCNKCAERQRAFRLAGVVDPTHYVLS